MSKSLRELGRRMAQRTKSLAVAGAGSLALVAGAASAQTATSTGTDFSGILSGLDNSTIITALVSAGSILVGVSFAKWGTKKVAGFFGG